MGRVDPFAANQLFDPATCKALGLAFDTAWQKLLVSGSALASSGCADVTRDALAMRTLVESDWYTEHFRSENSFTGAWELAPDQDEKTWYATTRGGHRISYSVNARVTGKKGDVLIVDDVFDSGRTLLAIVESLKAAEAASTDSTNPRWFRHITPTPRPSPTWNRSRSAAVNRSARPRNSA